MKDSLKFYAWPAIAGLLAALLILDRWAMPYGQDGGSRSAAPVTYADAVNRAIEAFCKTLN